MRLLHLPLAAALAVPSAVLAASTELATDDLRVEFVGAAPKFKVYSNQDNDGKRYVMTTLGKLTELDENGQKTNNKITGLASEKDLNLVAREELFATTERDTSGDFITVSVPTVSFEGVLSNGAAVIVKTYLFDTTAEYILLGATTRVEAGSFKWSIQVDGWDFGGLNHSLQMEMDIKEGGSGSDTDKSSSSGKSSSDRPTTGTDTGTDTPVEFPDVSPGGDVKKIKRKKLRSELRSSKQRKADKKKAKAAAADVLLADARQKHAAPSIASSSSASEEIQAPATAGVDFPEDDGYGGVVVSDTGSGTGSGSGSSHASSGEETLQLDHFDLIIPTTATVDGETVDVSVTTDKKGVTWVFPAGDSIVYDPTVRARVSDGAPSLALSITAVVACVMAVLL